jgi:very-short-patch-repair endonuclease
MSVLEETLLADIHDQKLPEPQREYKFSNSRQWRFDFAWPDLLLAAEVEGGTWTGGRHTRGSGFEKDCEKYNCAAIYGWAVLRFTGGMVEDKRAIYDIQKAIRLAERGEI